MGKKEVRLGQADITKKHLRRGATFVISPDPEMRRQLKDELLSWESVGAIVLASSGAGLRLPEAAIPIALLIFDVEVPEIHRESLAATEEWVRRHFGQLRFSNNGIPTFDMKVTEPRHAMLYLYWPPFRGGEAGHHTSDVQRVARLLDEALRRALAPADEKVTAASPPSDAKETKAAAWSTIQPPATETRMQQPTSEPAASPPAASWRDKLEGEVNLGTHADISPDKLSQGATVYICSDKRRLVRRSADLIESGATAHTTLIGAEIGDQLSLPKASMASALLLFDFDAPKSHRKSHQAIRDWVKQTFDHLQFSQEGEPAPKVDYRFETEGVCLVRVSWQAAPNQQWRGVQSSQVLQAARLLEDALEQRSQRPAKQKPTTWATTQPPSPEARTKPSDPAPQPLLRDEAVRDSAPPPPLSLPKIRTPEKVRQNRAWLLVLPALVVVAAGVWMIAPKNPDRRNVEKPAPLPSAPDSPKTAAIAPAPAPTPVPQINLPQIDLSPQVDLPPQFDVEPYTPSEPVTVRATSSTYREHPTRQSTPLYPGPARGDQLDIDGASRQFDEEKGAWMVWYQVRLSDGRRAYIRSDLTSAELS